MTETKIKAIGIESAGDETLLKKLTIQQKKLGSRDILVEVKAVATNPVDCKHRMNGGAYFLGKACTAQNPLVLGYDAAGVVVDCGSEVKYYKKGDEVYYAGSIIEQGSNAQFQVVDERIVGIKPKSLNWNYSAAFPLVALTAWEAMFEKMTIKPSLGHQDNANKSILIIGGAGGVGCIAIQLAKLMGVGKVIATASRPDTVKFCQEMGADFVVNHSKSLVDELLAIGIKDINYMLITCDITQKHIDEACKFVKLDGEICGITGFHNDLKLISFITKRLRLSMELMFSKAIFQEKLDSQKQILDEVSKLIDSKKLKQIGLTFSKFNIENLQKAHKLQQSGTAIGKIVLDDVDVFFKSS